MIEYRNARSEERGAYIRFANMVFGQPGENADFEGYMPKVYGEGVDSARMHSVAVDSRNEIRALVGVMPNALHVGGMTLKTGFIGTVSVHPESRGEGHMRRLMEISDAQMRENGTDLAFLSGSRQRYEYFGYMYAGEAWMFRIAEANVRHALHGVDASTVAFERILSCTPLEAGAAGMHDRLPFRFERDGFASVCNTAHMLPWAILIDGEPVGWLVCNEEKNRLVELQTASADAMDAALKAWIAQNGLPRIELTLAPWQTDLILRLNRYAGNTAVQHSTQARVFRYARVMEAFLRLKAGYARLADGSLSVEVGGERFTVEVSGGAVRVGECAQEPLRLSENEACMMMFHPHAYEGRPETPAGWFPLPLHIATPDEF